MYPLTQLTIYCSTSKSNRERHGERFPLADLSSSNGTFLQEQRLAAGTSSELADGDEIQIGSARLIFHLYRFIPWRPKWPRGLS